MKEESGEIRINQSFPISDKGGDGEITINNIIKIFADVEWFKEVKFKWGVKSANKPFTLGSPDKLYIRAEISISFCTEDGMLNVTETAANSFSNFYWLFTYLISLRLNTS